MSVFPGTFSFSNFRIMLAVSFKYVSWSRTSGCRKKSTNSEIFSTGQLFADIIGLALVGGSECILFKRYNSAVRAVVSAGHKYSQFLAFISLFSLISHSVSRTSLVMF